MSCDCEDRTIGGGRFFTGSDESRLATSEGDDVLKRENGDIGGASDSDRLLAFKILSVGESDGESSDRIFRRAFFTPIAATDALLVESILCPGEDEKSKSDSYSWPGSVPDLEFIDVTVDDKMEPPSMSSSGSSISMRFSSSAPKIRSLLSMGRRLVDVRLDRLTVRNTSYLKVGGKSMRPSRNPGRLPSFMSSRSWSNSSAWA